MGNLSFADIMNKTLLIGLTYYKQDGIIDYQRQYWGTVIKADKELITIQKANGETVSIPPDLRSIKPADKGEYHLLSTGEVVIDPDYTSSWSIYPKSDDQ